MNKRLKYSGTDKMSDLICENYKLGKVFLAAEDGIFEAGSFLFSGL